MTERIAKDPPLGQEPVRSPRPVRRDGNPALSFAQQRLWFLDQFEPNNSVYNVPIGLRLRGPLNVASLERSLNEIVRRHEALRTTFPAIEGQPFQLISESLALSLPVTDLTDLAASQRENEALRLANQEAQRPFDLTRGPLVRATLLRLSPEDHILLLTLHHIVSDAWSIGVLYRELTVLYEAFSNGRSSRLPELPIQYLDFAQWQRDWLQGEVLKQQLSYWKKQLKDVPILQLPTDRPRPPVQSFRGARQSIVLSKQLTEEVKALSRREKASLFMTLLAVFKVLLYRYTGQENIVVGSPIANRGRVEFEELIGFFLNTLALRTDLSGHPSFLKLLARVREVAFEAYDHQDLPFEKLVEELQPERALSQNPLFQVLFVFQNDAVRDLKLSGLTISSVKMESNTTKFDLSLFMAETEQGLMGTAQYNTDLFDAGTMRRMLEHFQTLLEGIVANPQLPISHLPLLPQWELHRLLAEWNETSAECPRQACVHELFEAQAARIPDTVAVVFNDKQLTYRELNQRANRLAHRLQSLGVGPEVSVGICMERSLELVVAVLAVLKAGGAYVPLDPGYPKERLAFMLEDARASVLLTERLLAERLPRHSSQVIFLDTDWHLTGQEIQENPASDVTAENLAYVIYTSGSTGKPKAVAMAHGSLCNLIAWQLRNFRPPVQARTLQFASLSFDVSFQEIFTTWCSGGTLLLIPEELRRDTAGLLPYLRDNSVERLSLPFVALQRLAEVADEETVVPASLREVITAGEQLQITLPIVNWFSKLEDCPLHNQYGPSESHVVTAFTLTSSPMDWSTLPPIGRPIANSQTYLLDQRLNLVPIGIPGELYISGRCLARGYLNRPDLTAERFIPHPFSDEPGARMYRTGDLVRHLPDGNIEFLGRIDHQVKIRGFRIELGEIETVLAEHPAVRETVVLAREDVPAGPSIPPGTGKRLVAYVALNGDVPPFTSELRSFLKEKLPEYMVPSAFVVLDRLPLNPSGKVDRIALPTPDQSRPELQVSFVAPQTLAQQTIATIWAQLLKVDQIGIHDNFFDLGGHSLLATQVVSRMRTAFQVEFPLRALFEKPNIEELAKLVTEMQAEKAGAEELARIMDDIESLSDDEVKKLAAKDSTGNT